MQYQRYLKISGNVISEISKLAFFLVVSQEEQWPCRAFCKRGSLDQSTWLNLLRRRNLSNVGIKILFVYQRTLEAQVSQSQRGSRRTGLGECGVIGKVHLTSDMTEDESKSEIISVFSRPVKFDSTFPFMFLQSTGSVTKTLTSPAVSVYFQWGAQQVVSLAGEGALYIRPTRR